ncbi:hypothetical protein M5D96_006680 [Drosophila gunungcola]|uniref:Uncharacterized protein n=1 Tax=Drosophila gunungcola TaxID=103775 RepID=A0A9P9YPL5_9MUSC|nr:hypothetical protein M5D96_006680 [Drosophila gunungcola]
MLNFHIKSKMRFYTLVIDCFLSVFHKFGNITFSAISTTK